jgi:hypothetical protein
MIIYTLYTPAVEVRGIPLKPKYGLNGAPKAFSYGCNFFLT